MYDSEGRYFIIQLTDDNSLKVPLKDIPVTIEVDPETVCQYIGKTDINGKKIFENDSGAIRYTKGKYAPVVIQTYLLLKKK